MGVKHLMVSESKSKCGRLVTQGEGADCKNCARVQASQDAWAGKPAADMVAVATDVPGEPVLVESYTADFAARLDDDLIADGTLGDFCRCHHRVIEPVVPAAIKQPIRTCMGRRKRKATKRARKQAYGMKGGK